MQLRLEQSLVSGETSYFSADHVGSTVRYQSGEIGGKEHPTAINPYASDRRAEEAFMRMIEEKLRQGYVPTEEYQDRFSSSVDAGQTVSYLPIGEHVSDAVANSFTLWVSACLHFLLPEQQFLAAVSQLRRENIVTDQESGALWFKELSPGGSLKAFYDKAVRNTASHCVWVSNRHDEQYLVAVAGNPGANALQELVEPSIRTRWPIHAGPGAKIVSLLMGNPPRARLIDGTEIRGAYV